MLVETYAKMQTGPFATHAKQLGFVCMFWAHVEEHCNLLLGALLDSPMTTIIVNIMGERDKFAAIKACAFHAKPSDDWFLRVENCLNTLDNDLRPARNRAVHDTYWPVENEMFRLQRLAKVANVQSRTKELLLFDKLAVTEADLTALAIRIAEEVQRLIELRMEFEAAQKP